MFRARIYAQGFTLLAMVGGSAYWQTDRQKRKEFDDVVAERKAKEKNAAWIRELESRDQEEKELRAERKRRAERLERRRADEKMKEGVKGAEEESERRGQGEDKVAGSGGKKSVSDALNEEGKGASSVVTEEERGKGVLESVSSLAWPKK